MTLPSPKYSAEYLDSVQARFPDLAWLTETALIQALEANEQRVDGEYERTIFDAFVSIKQEVLLESPDEELLAYLFGTLPEKTATTLHNGISYIVDKWGSWDLILWSWSEEQKWDFSNVIWPAIPIDGYNFFQVDGYNHFPQDATKKFVVVLRVQKMNQQDPYLREKYLLQPELVERSGTEIKMPSWTVYAQKLTTDELKTHLAACTHRI